MQTFEGEYKKLNDAQRMAVDTIEGPVMVVAGPGTGKTQILTLRIANIIARTDTAPENILALTFTEAAAANMRARLAALIGNAAYRVVINTFHGFCNDIIKTYPEDFPRIIGSKSITEVDQITIVESLIERIPLVLLKPFGDRLLYVRDIVSAIGELKREGITPERFTELVAQEKAAFLEKSDLYHDKGAHKGKMKGDYQKLERKLLKNEELAQLYTQYQQELFEKRLYDFSDMILEVLHALQASESLLQILQETHQYVLVDEHQDTNNAQNRILELLMNHHENPNLFVVGDEKQAIFRFQGASLENFYYFQHLYPAAKRIALTQNYRSTQTVLDTADKLIASGLHKNASHQESPIAVGKFATPESERYFVVHDIATKIAEGVAPHEIAILYRNNKDAFPIAHDLAGLGVPYRIESDQELLSHKDVVRMLAILRALNDYGNDEYITAVLHLSLWGIDPLDVYKVIRKANDLRSISIYELLTDSTRLGEIGLADQHTITELGQKLKSWIVYARDNKLIDLFEHLVRDTGLLEDMIESADGLDRFAAINALFDEVRALTERNQEATLADFFAYIETIKKHRLFVKRAYTATTEARVRLMTVHKSKGLEFAHVYIVGAVHGVFGGKVDRERLPLIDSVYSLGATDTSESSALLDDERRLFYVALTRAKESVTITYSATDIAGKALLPSVFLEEIKSELVTDIDSASWDERARTDTVFTYAGAADAQQDTGSLKDKAFVAELFAKQGLSPTALNNYLECPWKYFYVNLIRIPQAQTIHQLYGIAVHAALQDFFKRMKGEGADKTWLLESYKGHLYRQPLNTRDIETLLAKGSAALGGWYDTYEGAWELRVSEEVRVAVEVDDVKLTGVIDKIEYIDDTIVNVVDYKTAKPKTRNEIMGATAQSDGNYYRQLVFYKLLLEHYRDGALSMQSGTIDFVEPDDKGKYHKELFEISEDEVRELADTIRRVAREVTELSFWDKRCDDPSCEYCALRALQ